MPCVRRGENRLEKLAGFDSQGLGEPVNIVETDVPLSSLDTAHVGAVHTGTFGEGLLA